MVGVVTEGLTEMAEVRCEGEEVREERFGVGRRPFLWRDLQAHTHTHNQNSDSDTTVNIHVLII